MSAEPEVLLMVLCEGVRTNSDDAQRIDVLGLMTAIRSVAEPPFPVRQPSLCALILLTSGHQVGELRLRILHDHTGHIVFQSARRQVRFVGDPEAVRGALFRVRNCTFPTDGLYWVELAFAGSVIARQKLWLKT